MIDPDHDYSLHSVVKHLKYSMQKVQPKCYLKLEYRYAKVNQAIDNNKKFQTMLQASHQSVIVMNPDPQMKKNDYVHLKSMTFLKEFGWFQKNLKTLQNIHKLKCDESQKLELNVARSKIAFDSKTLQWVFKNKVMLFKPCYQAVRNGKLFRIALISEYQGVEEPKKKVQEALQQVIKKTLQKEEVAKLTHATKSYTKNLETIKPKESELKEKTQEQKDPRHDGEGPLRFKNTRTIKLNDCCSLVLTQVYQVINRSLYQQIRDFSLQHFGKNFISTIIQKILRDHKEQLAYEVELKFNPAFLKELYENDVEDEDLEEILKCAAEVMVLLGQDPVEFSAEEVVHWLGKMEGKE